ncbi:Hypothetical Protein FCC1311_078942 [Hondaea fermentalgiana]|uniref:Uncharacterized protein n=1 Tax=Hondaea fermentalgiana TaxID=2315210 RepID=A0A2R5GMZ5_9STRA|nr:Hypothetical Protein FCC1311_078942 [Hondaea fermentalgiana]|eukprot:GBG31669.1 Hypothetical Protein FCC1311_078942 [Hondaea fermentalgiana]
MRRADMQEAIARADLIIMEASVNDVSSAFHAQNFDKGIGVRSNMLQFWTEATIRLLRAKFPHLALLWIEVSTRDWKGQFETATGSFRAPYRSDASFDHLRVLQYYDIPQIDVVRALGAGGLPVEKEFRAECFFCDFVHLTRYGQNITASMIASTFDRILERQQIQGIAQSFQSNKQNSSELPEPLTMTEKLDNAMRSKDGTRITFDSQENFDMHVVDTESRNLAIGWSFATDLENKPKTAMTMSSGSCMTIQLGLSTRISLFRSNDPDKPLGKSEAWLPRLEYILNARYPCNGQHSVINYAMSNRGTDHHFQTMRRADTQKALASADIVIMEASVNDVASAYHLKSFGKGLGVRSNMLQFWTEASIRLLRGKFPHLALLWVEASTRAWKGQSEAGKLRAPYRSDASADHLEVLQYYDIPQIDVMRALGAGGLPLEQEFRTECYFCDFVHPTRYGQNITASIVASAFDRMLEHTQSQHIVQRYREADNQDLSDLPDPLTMTQKLDDAMRSEDITRVTLDTQESFDKHVVGAESRNGVPGWSFDTDMEGKPKTAMTVKSGSCVTVELGFSSRISLLSFELFHSYNNVGTALVKLLERCAATKDAFVALGGGAENSGANGAIPSGRKRGGQPGKWSILQMLPRANRHRGAAIEATEAIKAGAAADSGSDADASQDVDAEGPRLIRTVADFMAAFELGESCLKKLRSVHDRNQGQLPADDPRFRIMVNNIVAATVRMTELVYLGTQASCKRLVGEKLTSSMDNTRELRNLIGETTSII